MDKPPYPPPVIFVLGNFPSISSMALLQALDSLSRIRLYRFPGDRLGATGAFGRLVSALATTPPDAIVTRPSAFPSYLDRHHFDHRSKLCLVGNIGVSEREYARVAGHPNVELISAAAHAHGSTSKKLVPGGGKENSARSVAELTYILAALGRRPLHEAMQPPWTPHPGGKDVSDGRGHSLAWDPEDFRNTHASLLDARILFGSRWLCLGAGDQVRFLLPLLQAVGVAEVTVISRSADEKSLRHVISRVPGSPVLGSDRQAATFADGFQVRSVRQDALTLVEKQPELLRSLDVLSIHADVGACVVDADFLSKVDPGRTLIINVARGHLVDEGALVSALESHQLGGYATDVLTSTAEKGNLDTSPLWKMAQRAGRAGNYILRGGPNLILLPHVGGSTREAIGSLSEVVIPRVLDSLGVTWRDLVPISPTILPLSDINLS